MLIRADAGPQIGAGHVMRCLALAQGWQDAGGQAVRAAAIESPATDKRYAAEGIESVHIAAEPGSTADAERTIDLAREHQAAWVVVDGYHFDADYQKSIKVAGLRLLVIDDYGQAEHYFADLVLNQNLHAAEAFYAQRERYTRLLLRPRYVLLRREFRRLQGWERVVSDDPRNILVTMGGSDPGNVTQKVIDSLALVHYKDMRAAVVIGAENMRAARLHSKAREDQRIHLHHAVENMADLMVWADLGISSGGSTVWELAMLGLPSIVGATAPVEESVLAGLRERGLFGLVGWFSRVSVQSLADQIKGALDDAAWRSEMARAGRLLVDGRGCQRVIQAMVNREVANENWL